MSGVLDLTEFRETDTDQYESNRIHFLPLRHSINTDIFSNSISTFKLFKSFSELYNDLFNSWIEDTIKHIWISESLPSQKATVLELASLLIDYNCENWDGYNARPITFDAIKLAFKFISSLPSYIPMPKLVPEATGRVGMFWKKNGESLSLSIDNDNKIGFGAIDKNNGEYFGSVDFDDEIPEKLLNILSSFFAD